LEFILGGGGQTLIPLLKVEIVLFTQQI
jgi:hypothetical protein